MDKYVGKRLDGRYEIHDLIGVGGMAYVYRAYDREEDRWVAIKILKEEFSNNSDFLRRFRNESKAIAVLSHPNIVKVYDVSFGDRIQYIVMELIEGITLKQYIDQEGAIRWNEALHFTTQILMALECAHEKGIIHRDIKPQNIMLLRDGSIKVADFGIARFSQSETQTMTDKAIGSVHYIAPEQARGDYITDKADIYSVGVMLYEMLTGKLPFEADNAVSVALMQLQAKPVMPREINPSIPVGLEMITMKAMEKNPADRFQSAGEMLDDLDAFRRNPSIVFHYHLRTGTANYDGARSVREYDAERFTPSYDDDYEYEEELVRSRRSAKGAMVVKGILIALIVVLIAVGAVYFMNMMKEAENKESDEVELPNFIGMIYADEVAGKDEYKDFTFVVKEGNDPEKQPGEILNQNPKGGTLVKKGREVEITINGTVEQVDIPLLENYTQEDAIKLLTDVGLKYKVESTPSEDVEQGKVVKTDPAGGDSVPVGSEVTLYVSSGSSSKKIKVPDGLVGDLLFNVTGKLENAGFKVGNITYDDSSTEDENIVLSTNPASGTEAAEGSIVDITVSSGKGSPKTLQYNMALPSGVSNDVTMKIYRSGTLVDTQTINPSYNSSYTLQFSGSTGKETVVVTLDDQDYLYLEFDYDNQQVIPTQEFTYTPPETGGGEDTDTSDSSVAE
jgi:beta-lactam-binding protein with PASTA domain